jgi:hypothetical protein
MTDLIDEIKRLEIRSRHWYHADGTSEVLGSEEEVIARRRAAAAELEKLRANLATLADANARLNDLLEASNRNHAAFRALVAELRETQREFHDKGRRRPDTFGRARDLEKRVDAALAPDPEPSLF